MVHQKLVMLGFLQCHAVVDASMTVPDYAFLICSCCKVPTRELLLS